MVLTLAGATLAAGALSAGAGIAGSFMSGNSAKKAMKMQIAWERERAQNAHQWEVKDLQKAGLNPALSVTGGGQGANTSGISAVTPDYSGISSAGQSMYNALVDWKKLENETKATEATTAREEAQTEALNKSNKYINKEKEAEIQKKQQETRSIKADAEYKEASMENRLQEQIGRTEKALAEGRLGAADRQFLNEYGITQQQAVMLGAQGLKEILGLIKAGAGLAQIESAKNSLLKIRPTKYTSAKSNSQNTPLNR